MRNKIIRFIIVYLITVTIGTLSHFAFSYFNVPMFFKIIFPVNESIFEHLKLFFYPFILISIFEGILCNEKIDSFIAKRGFIISFIMLFEIVYITITSKLFGNIAFVNVSSYYILILVAFIISYYLDSNNKIIKIGGYINIFVWILLFIIFTSGMGRVFAFTSIFAVSTPFSE